MRLFVLTLLLFLLLTSAAHADVFQIYKYSGGLAVGAAVYFNNYLIGYTDQQGIISITRPPGNYSFLVIHMGKKSTVVFSITRQTHLKKIRIP